jgi:hypothetical protein
MAIITYSQSKREYTEGVGSLFQRELLAYLTSVVLRTSFKRSKLFFTTAHNKIYHWKKIHKLFNFFGDQLDKNSSIDVDNLDFIKKKKVIYNLSFKFTEKFFLNLNKKIKKKIITDIRKKFWNINNIILKKNTIVLHLRNYSKGDYVLFDKSNIERSFPYQIFSFNYNVPNQNSEFYRKWYVALINKIIVDNGLKKEKIIIYLCSTGPKKEFKKIINDLSKLARLKLLLNFNVYQTFKLMISAEYLILSQSSFSYLASFLNIGKKYIREKFRHPLPPDVILVKDYNLIKLPLFYYSFCKILQLLFSIKLFFKYTHFNQIIKNKFNKLLKNRI